MQLADIQRQMRDAIVGGGASSLAAMFAGGEAGARRLAIHQRHYHRSLVAALMRRYAATGWLVGSPWLEEVSARFVHRHPPSLPCIAEYGAGFPVFLAATPQGRDLPYLEAFATLDWYLGKVALDIEQAAVTRQHLSHWAPERLIDLRATLQPGVHYLSAEWPVDALIAIYLSDAAPTPLDLTAVSVWIEVRGSRGRFSLRRLPAGEFTFRSALAVGSALGAAAERALAADGAFDPGRAITTLIDEGLLTHLEAVTA